MFELKIALNYLVPRRRSLSTALISLLSLCVISVVVWLVLVFLSVTQGMEETWLKKLTSLHAPVRITPTENYYRSYYYQIDRLSSLSDYTLKTIGEKALSPLSDPYSPNEDPTLPLHWPQADREENGTLKDPVKTALQELTSLQEEEPELQFQDYEIAGALLRLQLTRSKEKAPIQLSQMSYLLSFPEKNPSLGSLLAPLTPQDLQNAWKRFPPCLEHLRIQKVQTEPEFTLPPELLPKQVLFRASREPKGLILASEETTNHPITLSWDGQTLHVSPPTLYNEKIFLQTPLDFQVHKVHSHSFHVTATLQGSPLEGDIPFESLRITEGQGNVHFSSPPSLPPPWAYRVNESCFLPPAKEALPLLLPKSYQDSSVWVGDSGTMSYMLASAGSTQEQRVPVYVAGFYEPGALSLGHKCILAPTSLTQAIYGSTQTFSPDGTPTNGLFVWCHPLQKATKISEKIQKRFAQAGIDPYWKIATYDEFEFSKDLMQQFRSDRTLFLLIASLILLAACSNIISLLVLLVNDKKKEIAILRSMGASVKSIAFIFGACGMLMGLLSSLIGSSLAIFTLRHLDLLVQLLSALQGHSAFHPAFFGNSLPNSLSWSALRFVLLATPLLSLAAGLIPAWKASRIRPSATLRAE